MGLVCDFTADCSQAASESYLRQSIVLHTVSHTVEDVILLLQQEPWPVPFETSI